MDVLIVAVLWTIFGFALVLTDRKREAKKMETTRCGRIHRGPVVTCGVSGKPLCKNCNNILREEELIPYNKTRSATLAIMDKAIHTSKSR